MRISIRRLPLCLLPLLCLGLVAGACGGGDGAADGSSFRNGIEIISLTGDGQGDAAQDGSRVGVRYRGTLDDGAEFDSNAGGALLPVTVGAGGVIAGFDGALRGLRIGQTIVVRIPAELAYGEHDEALVVEIPRAQTPPGMTVGQRVQFGGGVPGVITEITDEIVVVDANHQLAGQALTFEISIETLE
jgi:FKBP-type peptidyl-prolyl cis-trans isomerase 2